MNDYRNIYAAVSIFAMILGFTVLASAQRRGQGYDPGYTRYDVNISYAVKNLRNNARRFQDDLDRALDRSRLDGSRREDNINNLAKRFKNAAEDLDDEYEGRRSRNNSSDEARRVVQYGSQLDQALSRSRLVYNNFNLQGQWSAIQRDLGVIAQAYNIGYAGSYGRGNQGVYGRNRGGTYGGNQGIYGRNRGVYGGSRGPVYGRGYGNLRGTIVNLKNKAKSFENRIDNLKDRDRWDRQSVSRLENLTDQFKNATDRLEDRYGDRGDHNNTYDEARNVLAIGQQIDREISRTRVNRSIVSQWSSIESDLRVIANAYNIRYSGRSGFGIGDIIRGLPF